MSRWEACGKTAATRGKCMACMAPLPSQVLGEAEGRPNTFSGCFGNLEKSLVKGGRPQCYSLRKPWCCKEAGELGSLAACSPVPPSLAPPENAVFLGKGETLQGGGAARGCCRHGNGARIPGRKRARMGLRPPGPGDARPGSGPSRLEHGAASPSVPPGCPVMSVCP